MSTDMNDQKLVTSLMRDVNRDAEITAAALPPVDVDAILEGAIEPRRPPKSTILRTWIPRAATAAAVLAAAFGTLLFLRPQPLPEGPIPIYITSLVDSLYPETDYVHDELADLLWPQAPEGASGYLDDVWDAVISDIGEL